MAIQFSQDLIKYFAIYLGTSLREIAQDPEFPYSKVYLYKIADGTAPVNEAVNEVFNNLWKSRELTLEDLNNLYSLIDLIETGATKQKAYTLKKFKNSKNAGGQR